MMESLKQILKRDNRDTVVVYGLAKGKRSRVKKALRSFRVFFMDLDRRSSECADEAGDSSMELDSLEQAAQHQVDAFVIMRQMIADRETFRRLMEYGRLHQAAIYDDRGRNLGRICQNALDAAYCTKEQLIREIESHDVISFDIFDTLLTRKVLRPEDVFELTARRLEASGIVIRDFTKKRLAAQSALGLTNPDLEQIYRKFQTKYRISGETAALCYQTELAVEREVLIPRRDMAAIFRSCVEQGRKVCLVSDMYIPEKELVPILEQSGITGYDRLYISCDRKQLKLQGLLETYREENAGSSYLHIGDHRIHDGICAELVGMDYCLVESGYQMAGRSPLHDSIGKAVTTEEHVMLGMVIAKLMNSPWDCLDGDGRIRVHSDYDYSYGFCAPLISQFALWIYDEVKREKLDDILFASRDGYLMQKLYEVLLEARAEADMPRGIYFYTSRKAAVMTGINNEAFINMIINISEGMPPKKLMRERFGLPSSAIREYDEETYGDSIHKYVWDHAEAIFQRAEIARENYFTYMGKAGLQIGRKYAFMDFVSSGTSQKSLKRIVPFRMMGLYAGWNGTDSREELGVRALFEDRGTAFMRRYKLMETFLTSEEPSLDCFDEDGNPVFSYQDRTEKELAYVRKMQEACEDYLRELLTLMDPDAGKICCEFTDSVFGAAADADVTDRESVLNHLRLMDDWRKKRNKIDQLLQ